MSIVSGMVFLLVVVLVSLSIDKTSSLPLHQTSGQQQNEVQAMTSDEYMRQHSDESWDQLLNRIREEEKKPTYKIQASDLARITEGYKVGNYFEGDLAISQEQIREAYEVAEDASISTAGVGESSRLWPNGEVIFALNNSVTPALTNSIVGAMKVWSYFTCLNFIPWSGQPNFLVFGTSNLGCFSDHVGYKKGVQLINLDARDCSDIGGIVHEIGHALGLWHEQSRPDRDMYIKVITENIVAGSEINFLKRKLYEVDTGGLTYDFTSIMHYPVDAFSKNKKNTIEIVDQLLYEAQGKPKLGQLSYLSYGDYSIINKIYNCNRKS